MGTDQHKKTGFDAPLTSMKDDCFDHALIARSIHSIAVDSEPNWSVRIGVYSEWGTGKSTVLHFVEEMLDDTKAAWLWFNPWQFGTKDEMYVAFIATLFNTLAEDFGYDLPEGHRWKKLFTKGHGFLSTALSVFNEDAGKLTGQGLSFLNQFIGLSLDDTEKVKEILDGKRLVIFIDDLDRTDPSVAPELLFALKEIMDIPGFSFICAFDPNVVGKTLKAYHPGFGEGLEFLDKIIDYPVWLPKPTKEQLLKMAERDLKEYASFVPIDAFQHAIEMLPQNPRSIRQFIRLLTMLKPQIERHKPEELNWPVILGAQVIRVRFPKESPFILSSGFWDKLYRDTLLDKEGLEQKMRDLISDQLKVLNHLQPEQKEEVSEAIYQLSSVALGWMLTNSMREYQFRIADGLAAVTWKEFEAFISQWEAQPTKENLDLWIEQHSQVVRRSSNDISKELFEAAVNKRQQLMGEGVESCESAKAVEHLSKTSIYITLLEVMTADLSVASWFTSSEFKLLATSFDQYVHFHNTDSYRRLREEEQAFFNAMTERLVTNVLPYYEVLYEVMDHPLHKETSDFFERSKAVLESKLAEQMISKLGEVNFIRDLRHREEGSFHMKRILFDVTGPIWTTYREAAFSKLGEASDNQLIRNNAIDLFAWMAKKDLIGETYPRPLINDSYVIKAWFSAIKKEKLEPRTLGGIRKAFSYLDPTGTLFFYPIWWFDGLKEIGIKKTDSIYPILQRKQLQIEQLKKNIDDRRRLKFRNKR